MANPKHESDQHGIPSKIISNDRLDVSGRLKYCVDTSKDSRCALSFEMLVVIICWMKTVMSDTG